MLVDVRDPKRPAYVASYRVGQPGFHGWADVVLVGQIAYFLDYFTGLHIVDVSEPATPRFIGGYNPGDSRALAIHGNLALIAAEDGGLYILDVSVPATPALLGRFQTGGAALDVSASGKYAFVANWQVGNQGVEIVDLTNPAAPVKAGRLTPLVDGNLCRAVAKGNIAYMTGDEGLVVFDISVPSAPVRLEVFQPPIPNGASWRLTLEPPLAYLAYATGGLEIIDISYPAAPTGVGRLDTPGVAEGVAVEGNIAYVADSEAGLQIIDISDLTNPKLIANANLGGRTIDVEVSGNLALLADGGGGLQILDVGDPEKPVALSAVKTGTKDLPSFAYDVEVAGNLAFVADANAGGLTIIDFSIPTRPFVLGKFGRANALDVAVNGNLAYVAATVEGLQILDVTNPSAPVLLSTSRTGLTRVQKVCLQEQLAFVADYDAGLVILDVTDPRKPARVGAFKNGNYTESVSVSGDRAYLVQGRSGLLILDITKPDSPQVLGRVPSSYALEVFLIGKVAVLSDSVEGVKVIDVRDAANPRVVPYNLPKVDSANTTLAGKYLYIASVMEGLNIVPAKFRPPEIKAGSGLEIIGEPGETYILEHSTSVLPPEWSKVTQITLTESSKIIPLSAPSRNEPTSFFRLQHVLPK